MSIVLVYAVLILAGLAIAPAPSWRRRGGLALGVLGVIVPFVVGRFGPPELPVVRFVAALGAGVELGRLWELAQGPTPRDARARVFHAVTLFGSRAAVRVPPALRWRDGLTSSLYYALAAVGFVVAYVLAPAAPPALHWPVRWLGGVVLLYCAMDGLGAGIHFCYGLAGWRVPPLHDLPIASRSLGEFWGQRWNLPVSLWLRRVCFMPLARRGHAALGLLAAFAMSALLHLYLTLVAVGWSLALLVGALFVLHGLLIWLERVLGVRRWRPAAGRAWFLVTMLATAPLIVEPLLRVAWPGH